MSIEVIEVKSYEFEDSYELEDNYEEDQVESDSFEEIDKIYATLIK